MLLIPKPDTLPKVKNIDPCPYEHCQKILSKILAHTNLSIKRRLYHGQVDLITGM